MMRNGNHAEKARRVLVVEDDASVRRVLRMVLHGAGFEVTEAVTGGEALERLEEGGVSCVVLDFGLPDRRSGDVLSWLHRHDDSPPYLVISAMDADDVIHTDAAVRGRFIAKPFDPWVLLDRMETLVG